MKQQVEITRTLEQQDFETYVRHLICFNKSTKTLHRYFKRIQWMPYTHRIEILQRAASEVQFLISQEDQIPPTMIVKYLCTL